MSRAIRQCPPTRCPISCSFFPSANLQKNVNDPNNVGFVGREIEARLSVSTKELPLTLIIDNAELLIVHATRIAVNTILNAIEAQKLQLVLIRNRYILEEQGWIAYREAPFSRVLPRYDLAPLGLTECKNLAKYFLRANTRNFDQRVSWLCEWSGGIPGLMFDLKPLTPLAPTLDAMPKGLKNEIDRVAQYLNKEVPLLRLLVSAAFFHYLPSYPLLHESAKEQVVFLMSIGMLHPTYIENQNPFQGRFWTTVAKSIPRFSHPVFHDYSELSIGLENLLIEAHLAQQVIEELGCENERELSTSFEISFSASQIANFPAITIDEFLANILGRTGLRRLLRYSSKPVEKNLGRKELISQVMSLAKEAI